MTAALDDRAAAFFQELQDRIKLGSPIGETLSRRGRREGGQKDGK